MAKDEQRRRVEDLFLRARELPAERRAAFVAEQCGDDTILREEVEGLLAHDRDDSFLSPRRPASDGGVANDSERPEQIGPYRILAVIGEGGMGTVYLAEQREPVRRRVALKVVKLGMDTKRVLSRFQAERQALAMMEHGNIARVLDAGATDTGRPYFAMEYVKGVPITAYCDESRADLHERIALFRQVCAGVQHAHTKGVIHRDLKPSNVLVTLQDGGPRVKIIDFGLARATDHRLVEATLYTEQGLVIGTPEYMSPEQAGLGGLDIDTRTDVYSLGVLLYELLTGALPFDSVDLRSAGLLEVQRRIREDDPPRPSTRLTSIAGGSASVARRRRTSAVGLARELRGDLDWIVMKAIEKDRSRRYETAAQLEEDLRRHLEHEPVQAGPPSATYRLVKLLRRYRTQFAFAGLAVGALVVGLILTFAFANRLERALTDYDRLAVLVRLQALRDEAASLWPETPSMVPAFDAWLSRAEAVTAELPGLRRALGSLAAKRADPAVDATTTRFGDDRDQFLHDTLARVVGDIEELRVPDRGLIARVVRRREWASRVEHETIRDPFAAWQRAADAVRSDPRFDGLRLVPQLGLVPLGRDPVSGLEEFALARSGSLPRRAPSAGELEIAEDGAIVLVLLPGGTVTVGAQRDDPDGRHHDPAAELAEGPVRAIRLEPFLIGKHEVTQAQWLALAELTHDGNPSRYAPGRAPGVSLRNPVEQVDWQSGRDVLARHGLELPSESQWEYACRAGAATPWWTGRDRESLRAEGPAANLADATARRQGADWTALPDWPDYEDGFFLHAPVGSLRANPFGLHDVHGNVWEWCRGSDDDPPIGRAGARVVRGGSFFNTVGDARASNRKSVAPGARFDNVGLRAARELAQ